MSADARSLRVMALMICAEALAMLGVSALAATLPTLIAQWGLTSTQAGWLSGTFYLGYALAVPLLVSLTDRIDSRAIFFFGCVLGALAYLGFATAAHGLWTATGLWAIAGVSLAGVYMPGLRIITARVVPALRLRAVPYYTASFGIGVSLSFFVAGTMAQAFGWRMAFATGALGCVLAAGCCALATVGTVAHEAGAAGSGRFDLVRVVRNAAAVRFIVAYGGHCWELFAMRAWIVAFLLFAWNQSFGGNAGGRLTFWSTLAALVGVPASIVGAEVALRIARRRVVAIVATVSVLLALTTGWLGGVAFGLAVTALILYNAAILGDSGALTTGVVDAAEPEVQGATLALHSLVGFLGGALGPIAVGVVLGAFGGTASPFAWLAAFAVMGAGSLLALLAVR
ncbi:MAG: MFS transporter [Candidatus Eremiobacteraeota bacterium]|nr:MFS transporter [Candidatus Eremiobacteraeota bacterium]MBV8353915.1 MFS transporter [Candidatus Eremiobacteraeota bacterium]